MEKTVYESNVPRVYTLYRVSTIGQVEKDDIPMQKQVCRDFAKKQGWVVVKEFSEKGISGYKVSAKDRDAIQEIQHDAALGKFDILLVFMFDRLGRRDDETPFIVEWFVKNGVEVWSAMEGQQRFDNHVDKLLNYIRYWQASGESIKTSVRVKPRMAQLTKDGCFTGGIVLSKISNRVGILVCGTIMTASTVCFAIFCSITSNPPVALFWVAVALVGFGNSNVFSLFLSHALMYRPERQNEISGLMLMGLIGGAIFPPIMGALADAMSAQLGAIIVMSVGCIYVLVIGVGYKAIIEGKKAAVKA